MLRLRGPTCIFVLLLLFPGLFGQSGNDQAAAIVAALREQQFDKALELLKIAMHTSPENAQLWTMQGVAFRGAGDRKEALNSFRHAVRLSPDDIPALQGVAQLEFESSDPAGIVVLEHLLHLRPDDRISHGMLAILQYQQGDCSSAVVHFEKAAELFNSQGQALNAYGICLVKLKRFNDAAATFARALSLNPDDARQRLVLASVQLMAQQPDQAISTLDPLMAGTPDTATLELASVAYEDAHLTDNAVSTLRQAILRDPQNVNLYVDFAVLSATHQSFQVGIDVVNDGINLLPKAAPLYFARGVLYVQLAQYEKAQTNFDKAYELDPSQSLSVAAQGLAAAQRNDLHSALAGVEEKLAHRSDDPILLYMQADILTQEGAEPGSPEFARALSAAKRAVALRPALGPAHSVLAKLYLKQGQDQNAASECRKALEIDPDDQTAMYHLIQALRKSGNKTEIPDLLKRLAVLRQQATTKEREQYRYKLIEGDSQSK
jgi:tetratricopeptide (TPR) repeat protein